MAYTKILNLSLNVPEWAEGVVIYTRSDGQVKIWPIAKSKFNKNEYYFKYSWRTIAEFDARSEQYEEIRPVLEKAQKMLAELPGGRMYRVVVLRSGKIYIAELKENTSSVTVRLVREIE